MGHTGKNVGLGRSAEWGQFRFVCHSRVDVSDTDLGGIVYFGRYSLFAERGILAYRRHLEIPPLGPEGHLFVFRAFSVDYKQPARFDDVVSIWVRTTEIGRTSHTMEVKLTRQADAGHADELASMRATLVGVSSTENPQPTRIPEDIAERIRQFEG